MPVLKNSFNYLKGLLVACLVAFGTPASAQSVRFIDASPEAVGLVQPAAVGLPNSLWQGTTPQRLAATLAALPDRVSSPAQYRALTTLLRVAVSPPPGEPAKPSLASLRVSALARLGNEQDALELADKVSPAIQNAPLWLARLTIGLARYDVAGACQLALNPSEAAVVAEWQRSRAFCLLLHGQEEPAMVAAMLADELTDKSAAPALVFESLFLAKQYVSRAAKTAVSPKDILDLTMLRALNIKMAPPEMAGISPPLAAAIARFPAPGLEIRTAAAERAVAANALPADLLVQLYLATELTTSLGTIYKQMAYSPDLQQRLKAITAFWDAAENAGLYVQLARPSLSYLAGIDQAGAPDEFVARAMRTAMVSGDKAGVGAWRDALLARSLLPKGAEARDHAYAILALAGEPVPPADTWWPAWFKAAKPTKAQAALVAGLLEAMGIPVPKVKGPAADKSPAATAIAEAPFGEAALLAIAALNQPAAPSDGLRVKAVETIARLNRDLARAISVEIAIAAGI